MRPFCYPLLLLLFCCNGVHAQVKLYGMTTGGGDSSAGVIFSINSDGSNYQLLYSFRSLTDGAAPRGGLAVAADTRLYGLTSEGGPNNQGTIFAYDTLMHSFQKLADLGPATGYNADGSLVWFKNKLYGLAGVGGANGNGTIFSYDPAAGLLTKVYDLTATNGVQPFGNITVLNGLFYFTTLFGGANNGGVLNVYDPDAGTATDLHDFTSGSEPWSGLVTMNNVLYGVATNGGPSDLGSVFSYDPAGKTYKEVYDYSIFYDGAFPYGLAPFHGLLFGMTANGGKNGNGGTIGFVNPATGGQSQLYAWDYNNDPAAGAYPDAAPVITNDALLLGMTQGGGASGQGVIFSYDLHSNTYKKLLDFTGPNGAGPATISLLIPGQSQILPVRIVQFTGLLTEAGRVLNWTATQTGVGGWFELERSTDEVNYAGIDSVAAGGGAATGGTLTASYSYTDDAVLPGVKVAYYRLKMTDEDQAVSYSPVVAIGLASDGGDSLRLINTAVTSMAYLQYTSIGAGSSLSLRVVGMNGMVWIRQEVPVSAGVNSYSIDATALPAGMYILRAAGRSIKFVKM